MPLNSIPALKTALLFALGICIERYTLLPPFHILPILLITLFWLIFIQTSIVRQTGFLFVIILAGMLQSSVTYFCFPRNHITHYVNSGKEFSIQGVLAQDPVEKEDRTDWVLSSTWVDSDSLSASTCGLIKLTFYRQFPPHLHYGDEVRISGTLVSPTSMRNPGGFDYRSYLARNNIWAILKPEEGSLKVLATRKQGAWIKKKCIYPLRRSLIQIIEQTTAPKHQPFVKALTLGDRSDLSDETMEIFAKAGLIHLLAVSGLHVGFILFGVQLLLGFFRLPRPCSMILTILILFLYALLTEMKPPVTRAVIMASVFLTGQLLGRSSSPFNSLGVAALILLILHPDRLFDPGFQMSFSAVFSILYFYPKLSQLPGVRRLIRHRSVLMRYPFQLFILSLSAQIGTAPISVFYFNRFSPISLILNIAAIPLVGLIMALCLIIWLSAPLSLRIAQSFGALNNLCIDLLNLVAEKPVMLPGSYLSLPTPSLLAMLIYLTALILLFEFKKPVFRKSLFVILLLLLNFSVWEDVWTNPSNKFSWIQFDVGQGDAALLRFPHNRTILVDAGERRDHFDTGERIIAPYLVKNGIRKLDTIILTHRHADHNGGLPYLLEHFPVGQFITTPSDYETGTTHLIDSLITVRRIPKTLVSANDTLFYNRGILLKVLSPDTSVQQPLENFSHDVNNQSIVLMGIYGAASFLAMGDAETSVETKLLEQERLLAGVDILKAGHHGSSTSSSPEFIRRVNPRNVLISVGYKNRHGHPSSQVIDAYLKNHSHVFRTDRDGAIIFQTDGTTLKKIHWQPSFPYQIR